MAKCVNCLRGAHVDITGVESKTTLKMDMGGAVLYVMPQKNGKIEVSLNSENLVDGDYIYAIWNGESWIF